MKKLLRVCRLFLGIAKIPEVCEASRGKKDYHDYPTNKGGDGTPSHMYEYSCWNCGKKFSI
jgi:hypothetical protein